MDCSNGLAYLALLGLSHLVAAAAVAAESPAEPPPLIPLSSFATVPMLTAPNLSPDGTAVALRMRKGPEQFLVIHDLAAAPGAPGSSIAISLGKSTLNWVEWTDKRYLVASVRLRYKLMGDEVPYDRLVLIDRLGQMNHKFLGLEREGLEGDNVIYWAPDGSYLLLNVARSTFDVGGSVSIAWPRVMRVGIPSNELTKIQEAKTGVIRWVANSRGEVVAGLGWSAEGRAQAIYRSSADKPFETVLRTSREGDASYVDDVYIAHIDADSQKGYLISRRGGDRWGMYEYDFATRTYGAPVFVNDKYDIGSFGLNRGGKLLWTSYIDDRWRVKWITPEDVRFDEELKAALPDRVAYVIAMSENRSARIVTASSPTDPGTYYLVSAASRSMRPLASVSDALRGQPLAPMEHRTYTARDGLEIPAYVTLPVGREPSRLPLVVMPHGGPFARDEWRYDFLTQYLANRGYVVLQPNFRGSTGYGRDYEEKGYAQWGQAMQDDVDDGVRFLIEAGTVDPARVCILGWSYGGFAAQVASFRNPEIYRCAVSIAGISDLPAMLSYDRRFMFGDDYREWRGMIRGEDSTRSLNQVSSAARAKDVAMPLLIVHGADDDRVPVEQSDALAKALKKAGKTFDYVRIPDGDHSLFDTAQRTQMLDAVERFLALHNPTDVLQTTAKGQ